MVQSTETFVSIAFISTRSVNISGLSNLTMLKQISFTLSVSAGTAAEYAGVHVHVRLMLTYM